MALNLEIRKYKADSLGNEHEIFINDWIDVAIYSTAGNNDEFSGDTLYFKKHRFTKPDTTLEITVRKKPAKVGIDPFYKLIFLLWKVKKLFKKNMRY